MCFYVVEAFFLRRQEQIFDHPNWKPMADQSNDSTKAQFGETMSLLGLLMQEWVGSYLSEQEQLKSSFITENSSAV